MDEKDKKQIPLRLSASLWKEVAAWAEEISARSTGRSNTC
jgi:hypothetical protein